LSATDNFWNVPIGYSFEKRKKTMLLLLFWVRDSLKQRGDEHMSRADGISNTPAKKREIKKCEERALDGSRHQHRINDTPILNCPEKNKLQPPMDVKI
jgi:hypothetical protein